MAQPPQTGNYSAQYCRFEVYVPETHCEAVKAAIASAGAGKLGNYDSCMWQTLGTGQFRPLDGAHPYLGKIDSIERVSEVKIEAICEMRLMPQIISKMKEAHPYETVAFQYWPVMIE